MTQAMDEGKKQLKSMVINYHSKVSISAENCSHFQNRPFETLFISSAQSSSTKEFLGDLSQYLGFFISRIIILSNFFSLTLVDSNHVSRRGLLIHGMYSLFSYWILIATDASYFSSTISSPFAAFSFSF